MDDFDNAPDTFHDELERDHDEAYVPEDDEGERDYDDSMDGDHESALASVGWGTDEDYGGTGDDWDFGGDFDH